MATKRGVRNIGDGTTMVIGPEPTNGAQDTIETGLPYIVRAKLLGTSELLFHRWNCESVEEKGNAPKGSKAKKTDDIESYVWRNADRELCLPGEYVRQSIIHAAKYRQDPRSPRKSAMDLFKAGVLSLTTLAPIGPVVTDKWEFEDRRRVQIQRNGITRHRPAFNAGWTAEIDFMVNLPEYIAPDALHHVLVNAGRLIGVADFRPTFGRFSVTSYEVLTQ